MNPELSSKLTLSDQKTVTVFCKTFSQQKHIVLQSTASLQIKRFKVGSKMAVATSAPVLPNQTRNGVAKSPDSLTHPVFCIASVCLFRDTELHTGDCNGVDETFVGDVTRTITYWLYYRFCWWGGGTEERGRQESEKGR
jgi:hypothetical protein